MVSLTPIYSQINFYSSFQPTFPHIWLYLFGRFIECVEICDINNLILWVDSFYTYASRIFYISASKSFSKTFWEILIEINLIIFQQHFFIIFLKTSFLVILLNLNSLILNLLLIVHSKFLLINKHLCLSNL